MKPKDAIIGILLIAVVSLAGGLGFFLATWEPKETEKNPTYLSGLPDTWETAPNSTYIILNNQTHYNIKIYLKDILEGILTFQNSQQGAYDTGIELKTIIDPETGIPITGISITDLLDQYHTYFPGLITFVSKQDDYGQTNMFITSAADILEKIEGAEENLIIAISANKQWLAESPLGAKYGNFTLIGEAMDARIYNLEQINVLSYWTLDVYVDGLLKLSLLPNNITDASYQYNYTYFYDRSDDWNLNRHYWGINISMICDWVGLNDTTDFELKAFAADNWAAPHGRPTRRGFTETEVYHGLEWNSTYWDYINKTTANPDGVPLPDDYDGLPILLAYELQILGEYDLISNNTNPAWPSKKMCGFG
ncbi:MAG: hypothetical protein ACFE8L_01285, partial [Candidatus Hodarchaeota archaeon]